MNANLILWIILGLTCVAQILAAGMAAQNDRLLNDLRAAKRATISCSSILLLSVSGLAITTLWVFYSVAVHDWRFGVITGIPFVGGQLIRMTISGKRVTN